MMKNKMIYSMMVMILALPGCFKPEKHTYKGIQQEYSELVCSLSPLEAGQPNGAETCALNRPVTLTEAINIAIENNPDKKMAIARIKKASAMIKQANAAFYPHVGLYSEYVVADAPSSYLFKKIDQRELPPNTDFNDPGRIENLETGVHFKLNVYNGGKDVLNRKISETGLEIAKLDDQQIHNMLVNSVIHTYYDALAAKEFIRIAEQSADTITEQLRIMKVRFNAGGALKSDILSLEVRLSQAKEDGVRSRNSHRMAVTALSNILGISPDNDIGLKEPDLKSENIPRSYIDGLAHALEHRPEIYKVRQQLKQSRLSLDSARSAYLPNVNLQGRYYVDDSALNYDLDRDNWMIGLLLNWNAFDGFGRNAAIEKSKSFLEEMLAADRKALLAIKTDVKNAYLKLTEAVARLEVAEKSVEMAEESLNLVKRQYEGGSATITRYLEAELDLNRARTRSTAAYYDREKSLADIGRAIGYWVNL